MSITPFGRPVVPDEYGSTTTSTAGSIATVGGSASRPIDASERVPGASSIVIRPAAQRDSLIAARILSASAAVEMSELRFGVDELVRELVARVRGIRRRHDRAETRNRMERHGELG